MKTTEILPRIVDLQECVGSENLKSTLKRTPIENSGEKVFFITSSIMEIFSGLLVISCERRKLPQKGSLFVFGNRNSTTSL